MTEIINPNSTVTTVTFTKKNAHTFSGYEIRCKLTFENGQSIQYNIEHYIELFEEQYKKGIYDWNGEKFTQLENWEE